MTTARQSSPTLGSPGERQRTRPLPTIARRTDAWYYAWFRHIVCFRSTPIAGPSIATCAAHGVPLAARGKIRVDATRIPEKVRKRRHRMKIFAGCVARGVGQTDGCFSPEHMCAHHRTRRRPSSRATMGSDALTAASAAGSRERDVERVVTSSPTARRLAASNARRADGSSWPSKQSFRPQSVRGSRRTRPRTRSGSCEVPTVRDGLSRAAQRSPAFVQRADLQRRRVEEAIARHRCEMVPRRLVLRLTTWNGQVRCPARIAP